MLIKAPKESLLHILNVVQNAVATKTTMQILNSFYLGIKGRTIHLAATDLEIFVEGKFNADKIFDDRKAKEDKTQSKEKQKSDASQSRAVELSDGECAIPAKRFIDMIKEQSPSQMIEIKVQDDDGKKLDVRCGRSRFTIPCSSAKDFPAPLEFPKNKTVTVQAVLLRDMIEKTIFAASVEDVRYALNGVYFVVDKNSLKLVATDSRRLAFASGEIEGAKFSHNAIVPHKALAELMRLMDVLEATEVVVGFSDNQISFAMKDVILSSRLIDSEFPNYERVIPKESPIVATGSARELLLATRQLQFLAQGPSNAVRFSFKKNLLNVMSSVSGVGQGEVDVDIQYDGKPMDVVFNMNYISDFLKAISGSSASSSDDTRVRIELSSAVSPAVFSPSVDSGSASPAPNLKKYLYIVMPIRT